MNSSLSTLSPDFNMRVFFALTAKTWPSAEAIRARIPGGPAKYQLVPAHTKPTSAAAAAATRSEEHTSELQSRLHLVCRLLLEKKKKNISDMKRGFKQSNLCILLHHCVMLTLTVPTRLHP